MSWDKQYKNKAGKPGKRIDDMGEVCPFIWAGKWSVKSTLKRHLNRDLYEGRQTIWLGGGRARKSERTLTAKALNISILGLFKEQ